MHPLPNVSQHTCIAARSKSRNWRAAELRGQNKGGLHTFEAWHTWGNLKRMLLPRLAHPSGHMDFISPHTPWLGGKEIQGEPRGTFQG